MDLKENEISAENTLNDAISAYFGENYENDMPEGETEISELRNRFADSEINKKARLWYEFRFIYISFSFFPRYNSLFLFFFFFC